MARQDLVRRTIGSLEASCRANPDNPQFVRQLALAYAKAGLFGPQALGIFERASELFPDDIKLQRALAIGYMVGQGQALLRDAPALEDIDPERLARSIEQLHDLTRTFPESADIHRALGDLQLIRGDYREALQNYRAAIALGIEDLEPICTHFEALDSMYEMPPNILEFFADVYQRSGRPDDAQRLYQRLVREGAVNAEMLKGYYQFLVRRLGQFQNDPPARNTIGREATQVAMMLGRVGEALEHARGIPPEVLAETPDIVKSLGRHLIELQDFRLAFDYLSKIDMDQDVKALLNEVAVILEQRGEIDTAVYLLQYINEHDELSPGRPSQDDEERRSRGSARLSPEQELEITTELQLAELHWRSRRWRQAFDTYLRVLELGYEDYKTILEPLDSLLERLPDVTEHQLGFLANYFAERRDWRRTLFYAERALFLDPTLDDIRARMVQACEQILLRDPDSCEVRLKLGDMQLDKGNLERAMKEYRKSATYPEYSMKANRRIAFALFRAGDLKAAFQKYQELAILETEDLEHLYDLMITFQSTEQWRYAIEAATLIRDFDPNFRDVASKLADYQRRAAAAGEGRDMDPKMRELIGDHAIGRYKYMKKIGSGGMGVVHKVVDLKTNTEVAMKILREGLSSSDKAIDRFFREARIAATLQHRNIVNIIDYNISNTYGQSYIAMEFVDGPSLRDIVEEKFAHTVDLELQYILEVVDWMIQVCDALDATHRKGIIHRDIKPDNIMLAPNGVIKLTDFGIVHIEEATFTPTGALIGTPRYMSPEQVHGGRVDARSDIYSVGIIMYEILIGSPPFISGDISYQQVNVLPTNLRSICESIPEAVDLIVMKCLEKNPVDRYQSALELRAGLEHAFVRLGGNPERLRPQTREGAPAPLVNQTSFPITRHEEPPRRARANTTVQSIPRHQSDSPITDMDMDFPGEESDRTDRVVRDATRPKPSPAVAGAQPTSTSGMSDIDLPDPTPKASSPAADLDSELDLDPGTTAPHETHPAPKEPSDEQRRNILNRLPTNTPASTPTRGANPLRPIPAPPPVPQQPRQPNKPAKKSDDDLDSLDLE